MYGNPKGLILLTTLQKLNAFFIITKLDLTKFIVKTGFTLCKYEIITLLFSKQVNNPITKKKIIIIITINSIIIIVAYIDSFFRKCIL